MRSSLEDSRYESAGVSVDAVCIKSFGVWEFILSDVGLLNIIIIIIIIKRLTDLIGVIDKQGWLPITP